MVAKKDESMAISAESEQISTTAEQGSDHVEAPPNKPTDEKPATENGGFCVYIGPTLHGVIQSGSVYAGSREKTEETLASVIKKYPLVKSLIVTEKTFAEDRIKVKTSGNLLNTAFKKLVSGKKTL